MCVLGGGGGVAGAGREAAVISSIQNKNTTPQREHILSFYSRPFTEGNCCRGQ